MGKLASALSWAARGFRVFPLQENSKLPLDMAWTEMATTEPATIISWWTDAVTTYERDYNIGFCTTGWVVPDVDVKAGKRGLQTFTELALEWDTLTMRTPSGGFHQVYEGIGSPVGQHDLGPDINVRATNGYVVAPGSTIDGAPYEVVIDAPVAPFPAHLRHLLRAPAERRDSPAPSIDLDKPENLRAAEDWLARGASPAIEGAGGDAATYRVACRVRELGVSEEAALTLMAEHWNERCAPPWDLDELRRKIGNAYHYAKGDAGALTPEAVFNDVKTVEPPPPPPPAVNGSPYHFGNMLGIELIGRRPWVLGNLLLRHTVTTLVAGPGGGKTICKLTIAAHLAVGKDFLGHKCHESGMSVVFDAEDDVPELSRRLNAICDAYGFDREHVRSRVALVSSKELEFQLTKGGQFPLINMEHIQQLVAATQRPEVKMIALGPLVEIHSQNENDTAAMRYVMGVLRIIAREADVAVLVDHHTAKPPLAGSDSWAGSQFAGRGSSTIPGAARRVATLFSASKEDCAEIGIPLAARGQYVRLDDGKVSYDRAGVARWMKWRSVPLLNGDEVGVLVPHDAAESIRAMQDHLGELLVCEMLDRGSSTWPLAEAMDFLEPILQTRRADRADLAAKLERLFTTTVLFGNNPLTFVAQGKQKFMRLG